MESLTTMDADTRAQRLAQVKFVALDEAPEEIPSAPPPGADPGRGPHAPPGRFRLLQLLRRIASRVDGRPGAARP